MVQPFSAYIRPSSKSTADLNSSASRGSTRRPARALAKVAVTVDARKPSPYGRSRPWSARRQPAAWKASIRRRSAARRVSYVLTSTLAAAPRLSSQGFRRSGASTAKQASGRKVGRILMGKAASLAQALCHLSPCAGSSVVHCTVTRNCRSRPRVVNSGLASFSLHASQISFAVAGESSLPVRPKGKRSSRWVQW